MRAKPLNRFIIGIFTFILFLFFSWGLVTGFLESDHAAVFATIPDSKSLAITTIISILLMK
jgi:hypothetical protein